MGHFVEEGKNLFLILNMVINNQNLLKLLVDHSSSPLVSPDIDDAMELIGKNIRLDPKIPDELGTKESFIAILVDTFEIDPVNMETKKIFLRVNVLCPIDEWTVNEENLRPFLIMSEVQKMLDGLKVKGIGRLHFSGAERIIGSDVYAGYAMFFDNHEFK